MRRLLPAPILSLWLWAIWLFLQGSLAPVDVGVGLLLALVVPWLTERLRPERPRIRAPLTIARLALVVLWDIVLSNIEVARRILGSQSKIRPGFLWLPLDLKDPHGVTTLAGIITMTPGTLSSDLSADRSHLLVHCFHLEDPAAVIARIKARYEAPLRRIFDGVEG
jgi:multicomponent K+:H+ antiporter subunit E